MKELSIEDKAKRYDEAIAKGKQIQNTPYTAHWDIMKEVAEHLLPELKESEDERIRKELIRAFKSLNTIKVWNGIERTDILAWLEKQGEQEHIDPDTLIQQRVDALAEVEQTPTDKVEPKFKVGDWVVRGDTIAQILDIQEQYYIGIDTNGNDFTSNRFLSDGKIHPWTIQDAKAGDVLVCESGWTCIFKALDNHTNTFSSYCFMDSGKWFCNTGSECHTLNKAFIKAYNGEIHPTTKEQRELLFKKMKEAGYEWDADKKELKKIEQNPAWSEEDEKFVHGLIRGLSAKRDIHGHTTFSSDNLNITSTIDWLESLKNRFLLYPVSVKYNEKDIDTIADTFIPEPVWNALEESEGEGSNAAAYDYSQMIAMFKAGVHWLKSLRPQNRWKPSLSQLNALSIVSKGNAPDDIEAIASLYNDLKKLKD